MESKASKQLFLRNLMKEITRESKFKSPCTHNLITGNSGIYKEKN